MDIPTSSHGARLLIDKEIADITARMQRSIGLLKTRRNELSPAVNIPNEVLLEIFFIIRDSFELDSPEKWNSITQICRHWRRVAVDSPFLWTRLHTGTTSHDFLSLMLERSKGAPLDISFTGWDFCHFLCHTVITILLEIQRVQRLAFVWVPRSILESCQATLARLGKEALLLEELTVNMSEGLDPSNYPPVNVNAFRSSVLRKLSLRGVQYHWDTLPFPSLTDLTLHGKEASASVSGAQFTDAFCQMRHLQRLSIDLGGIPLHQYTPSTNLRSICLPALERLEITYCDGHQSPVETFMSQLVHPRLYQLCINLRETVINHSTIIRLVGSSIRHGDFKSLAALEVDSEEFRIHSLPDGPGKFSVIRVVGALNNESSNWDVTDVEVIKEIMKCCITPFDSSDTLSLAYVSLLNLDLTAEQLIDLFAYLPHLKIIEADSQIPLFDALKPTPSSHDPKAPIPFPTLRKIRWQLGSQFDPCHSGLSEGDFCSLFDCLSARKARGVAMSGLHLRGPRSSFSSSQIKKLRDVVAIVTVRQPK